MAYPSHLNEALTDLAAELEVPLSRYEQAETSYKAVGEWLVRPASTLKAFQPKVYIQGSFRLGTTIRPISDDEDYDIDLVCEMSLGKQSITQADLKKRLGAEILGYAKAHDMARPDEGRRCWTLTYADGAQFHLDALPAISDGVGKRVILESYGFDAQWAASAIAITDRDSPNYKVITKDWPHSNPKGYASWFRARMAAIFEARRGAIALKERKRVEDIPEYRVRTPLQVAIQILKRHRDVQFEKRPDEKPISIILTTLAAQSYGMEATIPDALFAIVESMDKFIEDRQGVLWIQNPTDAGENFADRWEHHRQRRDAFYEWLTIVRADLERAKASGSRDEVGTALAAGFGEALVQRAIQRTRHAPGLRNQIQRYFQRLRPSHKQEPPWTLFEQGRVVIQRAEMERRGFRTTAFKSDASALPKHTGLLFEAATTVPRPYDVYWQVVNTGPEAGAAGQLRGGFDEGNVSQGHLSRKESTSYSGTHSIECFIVKSGLLAARSGQFIVNIA